MILVYSLILVLPHVLAQKPIEIKENLLTKEAVVSEKKETPSVEVLTPLTLHTENNDESIKVEKKVDPAVTVEIKPLEIKPLELNPLEVNPLEQKVDSARESPKPVPEKKPKAKPNKSKLTKKQRKDLRKKNLLKQRRLRKQRLNRRRQLRKKLWRNRDKKRPRNIGNNKLSEVIDLILSQHRKGEGSKLSTQYIHQRVLDLLKENTKTNAAITSAKDCPKPNINKAKKRNLLRSLKRKRNNRRRPRPKTMIVRGRQRISVKKGDKSGKDVTKKFEKTLKKEKGRPSTYVTEAKKGKVKSRVTVTFGRKKPRKSQRKSNRKSSSKKN